MSAQSEAGTPVHAELREAVRRFARERLAPKAPAWDREKRFPREEVKGLAQMGLMGVAIPERWDGAGMDTTALAIACEEVAAGDGAKAALGAFDYLIRATAPAA